MPTAPQMRRRTGGAAKPPILLPLLNRASFSANLVHSSCGRKSIEFPNPAPVRRSAAASLSGEQREPPWSLPATPTNHLTPGIPSGILPTCIAQPSSDADSAQRPSESIPTGLLPDPAEHKAEEGISKPQKVQASSLCAALMEFPGEICGQTPESRARRAQQRPRHQSPLASRNRRQIPIRGNS